MLCSPREEVEGGDEVEVDVRALRIQEMIVLFLFILFSSMKEENLMKFVFQTVFLNITIPISAIQGDLKILLRRQRLSQIILHYARRSDLSLLRVAATGCCNLPTYFSW